MTTINKLIIVSIFISMVFVLASAIPGIVQAQSNCTSNYQQRCQGNDLYWYDSCGNQQGFIGYCANQNYNNSCTYHSSERCVGNNLYWYDSCGTQQDLAQYCASGCYNNSCQNYNYNNGGNCTLNYQQICRGNSLYSYDSCGNQTSIQYCANGCYNNSCQNNQNYYNNTNCTSNYQQRCVNNNIYWYDSCGNQQNFIQYCPNGCNSCGYNNNNYNNNYGNCTYHAYKACQGNNIYWYDSCGVQQDFYSGCVNGQTCQYGQCVAYIINPVLPPVQPYVAHYKTACSGNSVSWYDSLGVVSGLYKNCADNNSCTADTCSGDKCLNTIKCDGSTCAVGSADYNNYCLTAQVGNQNHCGNGLCEPNLSETTANCPNDCKINTSASGLSISFFAKQDSNSVQWQKTTQVGSNGQVYFMISAVNNSTAQIDNAGVSANIPSEISSLGNLQVNGVPVSGDIVSGINIGSIAPSATKSITFEGRTQTISSNATKQATATSNVSGAVQSDSISIDLAAGQVAGAAVSTAPAGPGGYPGFWGFLKRWYVWILAAFVIICLFVVVFRRFSSEA